MAHRQTRDISTIHGVPADPRYHSGVMAGSGALVSGIGGAMGASVPWWIACGVKPAGSLIAPAGFSGVSFTVQQQGYYGVNANGDIVDRGRFEAATAALRGGAGFATGCGGSGCLGIPEPGCVSDSACGAAGCGVVFCGSKSGGEGHLQYVGNGLGSYRGKMDYQFVGNGAGDFEYVQPQQKTYCICITSILSLLLLALLAWWLMPVTSTTTPMPRPVVVPYVAPTFLPPTPAPSTTLPPAVRSCVVYGDPHCNTFDGKHNDYYTSGEFWIVKSERIHIQARYLPTPITRGLSVTKKLAVGGPFLKGHVLKVSATHATWDGTEMLTGFPCSFKDADGLIDLQYSAEGEILQPHRETGMALKVLSIQLPEGVHIQINRWTDAEEGYFINVKIEMSAQPGQDGQCGNFNGNPADDDRLQVYARLGEDGVPKEELIFNTKTARPTTYGTYPTITKCPSDVLTAAHVECQQEEHHFIPSMECLVRKCFPSHTVTA